MSGTSQAMQLPLAAPLVDASGKVTEVWRRALQTLVTRTGGTSGTGPTTAQIIIELGDDAPPAAMQIVDLSDDNIRSHSVDPFTIGDEQVLPVLSLLLSHILSEPDALVSGRTIPPDLLAEDSTHRPTDPFVAAMLVSEG